MIEIIEALKAAISKPIIPMQSTTANACIVYRWYQISSLAYKLEIDVKEKTFAEAEQTAALVVSTLNDFGDSHKIESISSIELNGGGDLIDNETKLIERILYFDVVMK